VESLAISPSRPGTLYAGTDRGTVYRTTDGGTTWVQREGGFSASMVTALAVNPANPQIVYAGTEDLGLFRSSDGGRTWIHEPWPGSSVSEIEIDPVNPSTLYVSPFKSTDGGASWVRLNPPNMGYSFVLDPSHHRTIYSAGSQPCPGPPTAAPRGRC
jgi:hypothetical protein